MMRNNNKDRIALVTGANNGIGLELTRRFLSEGWQVIAMIRSAFPGEDKEISAAVSHGQLRVYQAELTDFGSLKHALKEIRANEKRIDLLFNNAGGSFNELSFTKQGREKHYELQTVVPYIVIMELKELLKRGSLRTIVNTSTTAFAYLKTFDPETLEHPPVFKKLFGPYAASKLAMSLWSQEIAPQLAAEGIKIRSADPGGNNTLRKGKKSGLPFYMKPVMKLLFPPPSKGASLLYDAAMSPKNSGLTGVFLVKGEVKELKFVRESSKVLEKVSSIYTREFATL